MRIPDTPSAALALGLPAQSIRRFVEQLLVDEAEVDDLVEEILGACIADFDHYDATVSAEQWAMRVAARVVGERWRRNVPRLRAAG